MPLSEYERNLYMELLNSGRVRSTWLCRIQSNRYGLAQVPVIFIADAFFLQGAADQTTAKILIGYLEGDARASSDDRMLLFKNISGTIIESDVTNIRRAFEQMVQWMKDGHPTDQNDFRFNKFEELYQRYFQEVKNGVLVDKHSARDMNKTWEEFAKLEPSEAKIKKLEQNAIANNNAIADDPLWALAEILKETLAVNPLWTGKGYTWTHSVNKTEGRE